MLLPADIIFENENLIVWNKPAGLITHASLDTSRPNLYTAALNYLRKRAIDRGENPDEVYLGLHHRLDRETSGAVVMTKERSANAPLQLQFANGTIRKVYLTLAAGDRKNADSSFTVKNFLKKKSKSHVMSIVRSGGDYAETAFQILEGSSSNTYFIQAEPRTGRTHQIRIHLASVGLPLVADLAYGGPAGKVFGIQDFLLHAARIDLTDPITGEALNVSAPFPSAFVDAIQRLHFSSKSIQLLKDSRSFAPRAQ